MCSKSGFIVKISSTCIDCIFTKQSMFTENDSTLISMTRKQCISLFSDLPPKLVTPSLIIIMASALPCAGQPKSSSRLGRCAFSIDYLLSSRGSPSENNWQWSFIVISFSVLLKSELQSSHNQRFYNLLHSSDACTELRLTLSMSSCFVLGESILSCCQASRLGGGAVWHGHSLLQYTSEVVLRAFSDCTWISYSVVNLTWVMVICVCLSMCSKEAGYDWFMIG